MNEDLFERDLRSVLSSLEPTDTPLSLQHAVATAEAAARSSRPLVGRLSPWPESWLDRVVSGAIGFVGLSVVALVVVVLVISAGALPAGPGQGAGGAPAIRWTTGFVTLEAESVLIEASGHQFAGPAQPQSVHSDPGNSTYRTLEVQWPDQGVEMRMNIYFAADDDEWWASEIRTYDGGAPGDWITYRGEFFRSALGSSWTGDLDLSGGHGRTSGGLHIANLRLVAFAPGTVHRFQGCTALGPTAPPGDGPVARPVDQPLADMGLRRGMSAYEAHAVLNDRGACHEFRLDLTAVSFSQRWCIPPAGKVEDALYGSEGQVIVFVEDSAPRTFDPNLANSVGC